MLTKHLIILSLLLSSTLLSQSQEVFDFEKDNKLDSIWWKTRADKQHYDIKIDSEIFFSGKNSVKIQSKGDFKSHAILDYKLPSICDGKKIKITTYIKTKDTKGKAGIWMSIKPNLGYTTSFKEPATGSQDWTKYVIELDLNSEDYKEITFGGMLVGEGQVWFDKFSVTVDENLWEKCDLKKIYPADLDTSFNDGSKLKDEDFINYNETNLVLLCKVWGLLKYHHPEIAKGNYNWDFELFKILPEYLKISDKKKRDAFLFEWIKKIKKENIKYSKNDLYSSGILNNTNWIKDDISYKKLRKELIQLINTKKNKENYYIKKVENIGNPKFKNEEAYSDEQFPDVGYRLLAVFKFWNVINYYFPYKDLISDNWNKELPIYINKIINSSNELEYELSLLEFLTEIEDSHGVIYGDINKIREWKGNNYSRMKLRFINDSLTVVGSYKTKNNDDSGGVLESGSTIQRVNGRLVNEIVKERIKYYPSSNNKTLHRDIAFDILRSNNNKVYIEYTNLKKESKKDSIDLYKVYDIAFVEKKETNSYKLLDENTGFIDIGLITYDEMDHIIKEFKDLRSIIIDMRKYPSAFAVFKLGAFFVDSKKTFAKLTTFSEALPGKFNFIDDIYIDPLPIDNVFKGKIILLMDENTQSQGEYTIMAFKQNNHVTTIGSNTAGANGDVSFINLPGGIKMKFTANGVYYPDGSTTQKTGIKPDIIVFPTIEDMIIGNDPLIEKAKEFANSN